jgi:hypothetical protein
LIPNPDLPGTLLVPLTKGLFAIIDEADAAAVSAHCWQACASSIQMRTHYARRKYKSDDGRHTSEALHQFLWRSWGHAAAPEIDHKNTNGLDCRRQNLRAADHSQNQHNRTAYRCNTSGFKGVTWYAAQKKWVAQIRHNTKLHRLGYFASPEEAAVAYAAAALRLHGDFARVE